jgi:YD repeat-containing protein
MRFHARKGLLSKIIYPTGGWDTIYYENNTYWGTKTVYPNASIVTQTVTGTGLITQQQSQSGNLGVTYKQYGLLTYTISKNGTGVIDSLHNKGTVTISENGATLYTNVLVPDGIEHSENIYMQSGKTYVIIVKANGTIVTTKASLNYHPGNITYPKGNYVCGGLRVAKTESYTNTGASAAIRRFYYYKLSNPDSSTGTTPPSTKYGKYFKVRNLCDGDGGAPSPHFCQYFAVYSSSLNALDNYPGGIAYSTVIEGFGNNFENGAIEHNFKLYENFPASLYSPYGDYLDNAPRANMGDYGGKETSQVVYKNGFVPVKKVINTYKDDSRRSKLISSYHCNKKYAYLILPSGNNYNLWAESYDAVVRSLISKWLYTDTTREIEYSASGGDSLTTLTMYYYDNDVHLQLTKIKTLDSKGDTIITAIKYAQDFANLTATDAVTSGIKTLQTRSMIKPVELSVYNKKKGSSVNNLVFSQMMSYYQANAMPSTVSKLEVASTVSNFSPMAVSAGSITSDSRYVKNVYLDSYDTYGNLLQQHKTDDVNHSYIWSYKNQYPVAEAVNAKSSEIYFNSFEEATGEWCGSIQIKSDRAHSGSLSGFIDNPGSQKIYCYSSKRLSLSLSTTKKFHYSSWVYSDGPDAEIFLMMTTTVGGAYTSYSNIISSLSNAGKWVLLEKDVDVPSNVKEIWFRVDNNSTGKVWYDDLRIYPSSTQMTTFTYQPLVGMTSRADISNRITYYTYDGLGRLSSIKDQDGNIIKKYCYGYDGQSIACKDYFGNAVKSQVFSRNNCGTGYIGGIVTYTVPTNKYFSVLNQADADLKAQNDITANGQSYANVNGSCTATTSKVTITAYNYVSVSGFTTTFTSTSTSAQTVFNIPPSGGVLGTLDAGTYNITIAKNGNIMQFTFGVCTNVKEAATSATFNNIAISSSCNTITLDAL